MTPDEKAHYYGRMEKNFPQFLKAMERLVAVPSYLKEDDDYPHVPAIKKVLDETMALMKDLGYRTYADPDGYYGWRSEERRVGKECRSRWSPYH